MQTQRKDTKDGNRYHIRELIDVEQLQRLQNRFSEVAGIFIYGVDRSGETLTQISGKEDEVKKVAGCVDQEQIAQAVGRVASDVSLEEQIVEDTEFSNIKLAAVAVRAGGEHLMTWIIYGVIPAEEGKQLAGITTALTERMLYNSMDLIREMTRMLLEGRAAYADAKAEAAGIRNNEYELERSLKRIEETSRVVQLFYQDSPVDEAISKALGIVGSYLETDSAYLFERKEQEKKLTAAVVWHAQDVTADEEGERGWTELPFLNSGKPYVISSDSGSVLKGFGMKAILSFPIAVNGRTGFHLCFIEKSRERIWQIEEIKFVSDTVRILQKAFEHRIRTNSLAASYTALESVLDHLSCGIYVKDLKSGEALLANQSMKENFQVQLNDGSLDQELMEGISLHRDNDSYEIFDAMMDAWYDVLSTEITWVDGRQAMLFSLYEITDKKVCQRRIEQQASTDFLTGLYNRMSCEKDLQGYVQKAERKGNSGELLYLDLDDFKHINDGLGHQYGDALLQAISNDIKRIPGIENTCYRMGGDEFVIIIPPEQFGHKEEIVEKIKDIFNRPWFLKDADYYCTMSMGTVGYPDDGTNVQELIKKADIAMYEAKKGGKNRVVKYSESFALSSSKRLDMEKNMRDATVGGYREFEVYYQPIIDIQKQGLPCVGAEALIRWNSPELGFISPAEFIPLAEYLGLINPIGDHVLRQACTACKNWNDHGNPNYKVNVNLSVVQLLQPDIVEGIDAVLKETGMNPKNLTLEVTESLAINDMERMKGILGRIKELGVRIALDDFGTGYSSLNHIREIPFDVIKVDQSFVKGLAEDAYSQSFIKMVSELADTIGVSICVEGIETKEQYKVLEGMKVRLVQGFYFDRPMTRENFEYKYCKKKNKLAKR